MDIAQIRKRDGDRCARCGATSPLHVHHRIRRSQGGRNDSSNLVTLCEPCHTWAHRNPYKARDGGWLLRPSDDPRLVEIRHVNWPAYPIWLDDAMGFALSAPEPELGESLLPRSPAAAASRWS